MTRAIFEVPAFIELTACLNASPPLAHAPSILDAGRGVKPSQSAMRCPRCACPSNESLVKLPINSSSISLGSNPLSTEFTVSVKA